MPRPKIPHKISIRNILLRLEKKIRKGRKDPSDKAIAGAAGIPPATYSGFKSGEGTGPTVWQLLRLAQYFKEPLTTFFHEDSDLFSSEPGGIRWRLGAEAAGPREKAFCVAALGVLRGLPLKEIASEIDDFREGALPTNEVEIRWMARSGLALGLVDLVPSKSGDEMQDFELSKRLTEALRRTSPFDAKPTVRIVRNLAHASLGYDPIVPFLSARVAHHLVATFLKDHPTTFTIGIAGGQHLLTFVRTIGPVSSPFPHMAGSDKRFTIVPLTLEPFYEHNLGLADALVGEMASRSALLLGPKRVEAPSFKPFDYMIDRTIEPLSTESAVMVRNVYQKLDVAIYGCGDQSDHGWIHQTLVNLGLEPKPTPATDVCLNMLSQQGNHVPLPSKDGKCEFIGVGIQDVRALAKRNDKLALLLTSGKSKGLPLLAVFRAGCANALVCDQAAAEAALKELPGGGTKRNSKKKTR
jgi:transcriptional regulator with XRE-family HTH domain